jgi:3-oxoacyl-[acyl-carrier protein] reductase
MESFTGKTVLVTGAGSGIGFGIAERFAAEGAQVIITDIDPQAAERAAQRIGAGTLAYAWDTADTPAVYQQVAMIVERFKKLDILVANAGITVFKPALEVTPEAFDRVVAVNLRGTYFCALASAAAMIAAGVRGRILLVSSNMGVQAMPLLSVYSITKAGINMMARALAIEWGRHGITVNAIAPGPTLTERTAAEMPDYDAAWGQHVPTGHAATVADVAAAALFLAGEDARQINGITLLVDGGWHIASPTPSYD